MGGSGELINQTIVTKGHQEAGVLGMAGVMVRPGDYGQRGLKARLWLTGPRWPGVPPEWRRPGPGRRP